VDQRHAGYRQADGSKLQTGQPLAGKQHAERRHHGGQSP
jgi:hypothetical protein